VLYKSTFTLTLPYLYQSILLGSRTQEVTNAIDYRHNFISLLHQISAYKTAEQASKHVANTRTIN